MLLRLHIALREHMVRVCARICAWTGCEMPFARRNKSASQLHPQKVKTRVVVDTQAARNRIKQPKPKNFPTKTPTAAKTTRTCHVHTLRCCFCSFCVVFFYNGSFRHNSVVFSFVFSVVFFTLANAVCAACWPTGWHVVPDWGNRCITGRSFVGRLGLQAIISVFVNDERDVQL